MFGLDPTISSIVLINLFLLSFFALLAVVSVSVDQVYRGQFGKQDRRISNSVGPVVNSIGSGLLNLAALLQAWSIRLLISVLSMLRNLVGSSAESLIKFLSRTIKTVQGKYRPETNGNSSSYLRELNGKKS